MFTQFFVSNFTDCDSIRGQWSAFEEMHAQKLTKSISVSNFSSEQLDCVLEKAAVKPVVNQLPYSVAYHPGDVIPENNKRGILVQAWAPLGGSLGGRFDKKVQKACAQIGKRHDNKSYAQVRFFCFLYRIRFDSIRWFSLFFWTAFCSVIAIAHVQDWSTCYLPTL